MEIRARYTLIGLFTLAVIAAGFQFVYWLNTTAGLGQRAVYRIRYDSPVSGLLKGSAVLFNGIRVGEVSSLSLDPAAPSDVTVEISVDRRAPVRADTKIGIDFQGLAGAPVVSLAGGSPSLPLLSAAKGPPPLLTAEKNAGLGMAQAARDALRHIDALVSENAEPVRNLITNMDRFSGALARNSDRVDTIIAGLERFTGGGAKPVVRIVDLPAARAFPGLTKRPAGQLLVLEPTALAHLDNERVVVRGTDAGEPPTLPGAQWPDMLPKVVQTRMVQSFENAGYMGALGKAPEGTRSDHQLMLDIRTFQVSVGAATAVAEVELVGKIVSPEGRIVDARTFRATAPVTKLDVDASTAAFNEAFGKVATEIVQWTCTAI